MEGFRQNYTKEYINNISECLNEMKENLSKALDDIATIFFEAKENDRTIYAMGNGGSGANASHFIGDLAKGTIKLDRKRYRAIALTDNIPQILAWANDTSYENIFVEQLKNLMIPKDVVIGISGSGNSQNVIKAIEYANENNGITIGLTGYDGGKLKNVAQNCIIVPSNNMQQIEDVHLIILHLISSLLRDEEA